MLGRANLGPCAHILRVALLEIAVYQPLVQAENDSQTTVLGNLLWYDRVYLLLDADEGPLLIVATPRMHRPVITS